ncbi:thymidylate kinase [Ophiostoma piceae UAMH 11346]|uniref:Thymidylate kinase n=1 Tax=Ophiostoma piceae (strain UAMH 11346) TaxID=1262450 RepID=S3BNP2_OPHP1|nr:thymidylate kinase [Ophiostoma piceae UAMH 11346]
MTATTPVRGALVILEGLDRSGKTTQGQLLAKRLANEQGEGCRRVEVMRFPDRTTPIGQMIDSYLKSQANMDDHVIHLLFSANRWEAVKKIKALLESGTTIVCDRYYYSGMVYSAAKQNPALSLPWARAPEVGLPRPDLVVFLNLKEDEAKKRGGWGDEKYEKAEMQRKVRELFWGLSFGRIPVNGSGSGSRGEGEDSKEWLFREEEEDLQVIDASSTVEEVSESIWAVAGKRVAAVERGEVGRAVRHVT